MLFKYEDEIQDQHQIKESEKQSDAKKNMHTLERSWKKDKK